MPRNLKPGEQEHFDEHFSDNEDSNDDYSSPYDSFQDVNELQDGDYR